MKHTKEKTIKELIRLRDELGHEPNTFEIEDDPKLPNMRYIQRNFGGIQALRKDAGFKLTNHTKGAKRQAIARKALFRSRDYEKKFYEALHKKFHNIDNGVRVVRQFAWQQWLPNEDYYSNTNADVAISDDNTNHVIIIDFFHPQNLHSLAGCVREKRRKYIENPVALCDGATHEIIFIAMNPKITQEEIDNNGVNKEGITILSFEALKDRFLS